MIAMKCSQEKMVALYIIVFVSKDTKLVCKNSVWPDFFNLKFICYIFILKRHYTAKVLSIRR